MENSATVKENVTGRNGPGSPEGALVPGLIKLLWALKADRPAAWSPAFEGIAPLDLHVLAFVEARPEVILKEVRDYLDVPNSTLTGVIDRLEKRGLVERTISRRDRRSYGLRLTAKGRALRKEQQRVREAGAARMLQALDSEEERAAFTAMVDKIGDRLARAEIEGVARKEGM